MVRTLAILGAGGHGKVVADAALCMGWQHIVFYDEKWPSLRKVKEWSVVGDTSSLLADPHCVDGVIIAIGNSATRHRIANELKEKNISLTSIIHPAATVSRYATIGEGTVVFAGAVLNIDCVVGRHCIINTGATIDHDCILSDSVHICPGAHLAGEVTIGHLSWIGIGACVRQKIRIGNQVMVGAGTVVINDITDHCTVVGVPGKIRLKREG